MQVFGWMWCKAEQSLHDGIGVEVQLQPLLMLEQEVENPTPAVKLPEVTCWLLAADFVSPDAQILPGQQGLVPRCHPWPL